MKKHISIVLLALPLLAGTLMIPMEAGYAKDKGERREDHHDGGRDYADADRRGGGERHDRDDHYDREQWYGPEEWYGPGRWDDRGGRHDREERHERGDRYDRGERHEREDRQERQERQEPPKPRVIDRGAIPGGQGAIPPKYGSE